jgi:hypothetical protein
MISINHDSKVIAITEINAWEGERWTYVLDLCAQDADTINNLFVFARLAGERYNDLRKISGSNMFAASKYWIRFYDKIQSDEFNIDRIKLINHKGQRVLSIDTVPAGIGYKSNVVDLNAVISWRKMKQAVNTYIRENENILYKNFESVFLKIKV